MNYLSFSSDIPSIPENIWSQVCRAAGVRWDYNSKGYVFQRQKVFKPKFNEKGVEAGTEVIETCARFYNFCYAYWKTKDFQKAIDLTKTYVEDGGVMYLPAAEGFNSYGQMMRFLEENKMSVSEAQEILSRK